MSTALLLSVLWLLLAVASLVVGIIMVRYDDYRRLGGIGLLLAFGVFAFWALPRTFEGVTESGTVVDGFSWFTHYVLGQFGPYVFALAILLMVVATVLLFIPQVNVDLGHGNVTSTDPHSQWVLGVIAAGLTILAMVCDLWLFQSRPNERLYELVAGGQLLDVVTGKDTFKAQSSRTGRLRAVISMPGEYIDKARLKKAIEDKVSTLPEGDKWKKLEVKEVKSATYFSGNGRSWTLVTVTYDGTLKADPAAGRAADEPVTGKTVRIRNEETDLNTKIEDWLDKIAEHVESHAPGAGVSRQAPAGRRRGFTGTDLFPNPSDFD